MRSMRLFLILFLIMHTSSNKAAEVAASAQKITVAASFNAPTATAAGERNNPLIDFAAFQELVSAGGAERENRRLTEGEFLTMMHTPGVVILDARTDRRYLALHVRGAANLPYTEFTAETLAAIIPSKATPVLIYCNNNFLGAPEALPSKMATASLNLNTYFALKAYGYREVFELAPLLEITSTRLPLAGTTAGKFSGRAE
jgi:phage shock protein E